MSKSCFVLLSALFAVCSSQRSPYAGRRPIGFPEIVTTTSANTQNNNLGNRFGEGENATTERLPVEALGDRELVNRLGQLPQDNQPFWLLNWKALEEHRKRPVSYPQRPNIFIDSLTFPNVNTSPEQAQNNQASSNFQQPFQNIPVIPNDQQPTQNEVFINRAGVPNNQDLLTTVPDVQNNQPRISRFIPRFY